MIDFDWRDLVKLALFSGLIGFAVFSLSYATLVWHRRSGASGQTRTPLATVSLALAVAGITGALFTLAASYSLPRSGVVVADDPLVVYAGKSPLTFVTEANEVGPGDPIARYARTAAATSPAGAAPGPDVASALQRVATLERTATALGDVVRLRSALEQADQDLRDADARRRALVDQRRSAKAKGDDALARLRSQAEAQKRAASAQLEASSSIGQASGTPIVPARFVETAKRLPARVQLEQAQARLAETDRTLADRLQALDAAQQAAKNHRDSLAADLAKAESSLSSAQASLAVLPAAPTVDAGAMGASAVAVGEETVTSPFAGRVIYRNAGIRLAPTEAPVIAVARGEGFLAKVRVQAAEFDELSAEGLPVPLLVGERATLRRLDGRLVGSEPVPGQDNDVLALVATALPADLVAIRDGSVEARPIRLDWHPDILKQRPMQVSLGAALLGLLGCIAFSRGSAPSSRTGAAETDAPTQSVRARRQTDADDMARMLRTGLLLDTLHVGDIDLAEDRLDAAPAEMLGALNRHLAPTPELQAAVERFTLREGEEQARRLSTMLSLANSGWLEPARVPLTPVNSLVEGV